LPLSDDIIALFYQGRLGRADMAFWRPGTSAPGLGLERHDDIKEAEASSLIGFNPRHSLPLDKQRIALPIHK